MGNYRTTYMELDDFRVSCIQGYPYEGFVIGCGYAYVENIPSEMAILENSSYIYNPIKVQQIDTSLLAIIKSLHLTPDDIRNKLVSEKGDMYVLNIPEGPLTIPKKDSEIMVLPAVTRWLCLFRCLFSIRGRSLSTGISLLWLCLAC